MKAPLRFVVALWLGTLAAAPARAHEYLFEVQLADVAGGQGTGSASALLDLDLVTLDLDGSFTGLSGPATEIRIHCCTSAGGTGTAEAATAVANPAGFPVGAVSGPFSMAFDLTTGDSYTSSFMAISGGTVSDALNALVFGLQDGKAYVVVATTANPGGELSGFLAPIPEPSAAMLLLVGLVGLVLVGATARRRN
jgi:hypothetical protein